MTADPSAATSGLAVIDKPAGLTSHDVVARVRRLTGTRKVGHAGTLDPMATGVLILGVNRATRLLGHLLLADKSYDAIVRLGQRTSTDDADGDILESRDASVLSDSAVREELDRFVGDLQQVPSSVSAIKVDGRRAYDLARAGEEVTLKPRPVTIHALRVGGLYRHERLLDVTISVRCSTGTYVRAIARDLGAALGVGGHLTALRRTSIGPVDVAEALPLDVAEQTGSLRLMSMGAAARRFFPVLEVDARTERAVSFGQPLHVELPASDGPVALLGAGDRFLALYARKGDVAAPVAVFV